MFKTKSKNTNESKSILINFNVPSHLKYKFDRIVKFKGISRSSVLNRFLDEYVHHESQKIHDDGKLYEMMSKLENTIERNILRNNQLPPHETLKPNKQPSWEKSYMDDTQDNPLTLLYIDGR